MQNAKAKAKAKVKGATLLVSHFSFNMWQQTSGQVAAMVSRAKSVGLGALLHDGMEVQNSQNKTVKQKQTEEEAPTLSTSSSSMFKERKKIKTKGKTLRRADPLWAQCAPCFFFVCGQSVLAQKVQSRTVVSLLFVGGPSFSRTSRVCRLPRG